MTKKRVVTRKVTTDKKHHEIKGDLKDQARGVVTTLKKVHGVLKGAHSVYTDAHAIYSSIKPKK